MPPSTPYAQKEPTSAEGIPDRHDYGDLARLPVRSLVDWIVSRHDADKAGPHTDVRLGTGDTGLYSWAARKGLPPPGKKHLAVRQPLHSHGHLGFEGEIAEGYGKGTVKTEDQGKVLVTKVEPDKVHFTVAHRRNYPERFVLFKPKGGIGGKENNWLLMNTTPVDPLKYDKLRYKSIPADQVEGAIGGMQPGTSVQAKLDGALTLSKLLKGKLELISYRTSKATGRPIVHSERVFRTTPEVEVPKDLDDSVFAGELYATRNGGAVEPQRLGGLLNAAIAKSIPEQDRAGIGFRNQLFDVRRLGGKDVTTGEDYAKRIAAVKRFLATVSGPDAGLVKSVYHAPESAETPEEAKALYARIASGAHPGTTEGIVIHPPTGAPLKSKLFDEHDVYVRGFFPGKGKYRDRGVGGFVYSHEPKGPIVGEIGTGFSDAMREDMHANPKDYIGRTARVRTTRKLPSGALFQPSLLAMHEDYPMAEVTS